MTDMQVCIHRGTHEIGGTCIEIESGDERIVLDAGLPLDVAVPEELPLHPIRGFGQPDPSLLGVVISHPHQDHYGLAHRLPPQTHFLIGKAAESILAAAELFSPGGIRLPNVTHLDDRKSISLGPFTVTPYLVDHSAYDSYAVLVEADGRRLFYSGDFRAHGRKGKLVERLIHDPPRNVDVLLMEGTTIGRGDDEHEYPSESDLEGHFVDLFRQTEGMPLVWCSGQNIDRIVTVFRACRKAGRQFIIDMYTAHVLRATGNANVPQAEWPDVRVFLPFSQKMRIIKQERFDVAAVYRARRVFPEQLKEAAPHSVMLFRPSMMRDVEQADCLHGARVICSVWPGYLAGEQNQGFLQWLRDRQIPMEYCHTSGHASITDLKRLASAIAAQLLIPVHTFQPARFHELFSGVVSLGDGQNIAIGY